MCCFIESCTEEGVYCLCLYAADVGNLYKRLLNHRPVIQNEVHFFLKEFEVYVLVLYVAIYTLLLLIMLCVGKA